MSFGQQRLWLLDRIESAGSAYNVPAAVRLRGPLDVAALHAALTAIVARHEVLRTTFALHDGAPVQIVGPAVDVPLPLDDCSDVPAELREPACRERIEADAWRPFDLARGPVVRARLVRLALDEHVLLLARHHIVNDAWSNDIYRRELRELYRGFREGKPVQLPALPLQYADFAVRQRAQLQGALLEEHLTYWMERLSGAPGVTDLPLDRPRPHAQTFAGAVERLPLPDALATRLDALARAQRVTPFILLLAAFAVLLARYTARTDLVVGTPIANRAEEDLHGLIGFFVNTLALRMRVDPDVSFAALLAGVRDVAFGAYEHQVLPFERLIEELHPQRDLSHAPLANVFFILQQAGGPAFEFDGIDVTPYPLARRNAKFDLMLQATRERSGLTLAFEYAADLFERETIVRMLRHLQNLLEAVAADPQQPIGALPLLAPDERHQIVYGWNATPGDAPAHTTVTALVEEAVRRSPERVAVTFGDQSLTYAELDARANALAARLQAQGVGRGSFVGVRLERSLAQIVAVLATLKAGAAYVPLDPAYPPDRLARMQSAVGAVITRAALEELPPSAAPPATQTQPGDLAYVLYTSGSTGTPKGVAMPHRALVNLVRWQIARSGPSAAGRTLQFASLAFDVSFQEIFTTLAAGGTLVLVGEEVRRDVDALIAFVRAKGVNRLFLPYVLLQRFVEAAEAGNAVPDELREVITAGEQLKITPAIRRFFSRLPACVLDNQYGPTEAHVVSAYALRGAPDAWPELPPIGTPLPNVRLHVLDERREPVPPGVHGELYIGGIALADGYLGRPDLTAERFVPDPFSRDGARLYRTGDLARYRTDGVLEYLGRIDRQVKVRGFRVELGDVEAALRRCTGVRDAAATLDASSAVPRLVAYVIPAAGPPPAVRRLREQLGTMLPEYMVPAEIGIVDAFPLSPNGKLDVRALAAPAVPEHVEATAPDDPLRTHLLQIWRAVLGSPAVQVDDDFFACGGNSLLAVVLASKIAEATGRRIPVASLFEAPSVAGIARLLVDDARAAGERIVVVRDGGPRPAFFFVHGDLKGCGYYARALAACLDPEQPFAIVVPHGIDGRPVPASIEAIAEDNVRALRAVQPHGPYRLGGYCVGGLVAYEMAVQLRRAGERVERLVLIDSAGRNSSLLPLATAMRALRLPEPLVGHIASRMRPVWFARRKGWRALAALALQVARRVAARRRAAAPVAADPGDVEAWSEAVLARWEKLGERYVPPRFDGALALLWPEAKRAAAAELTAHWTRVAPAATSELVPGEHLTCITTYVSTTGAVLSRILA
jgi:amino acid adenylation domain-containing protein